MRHQLHMHLPFADCSVPEYRIGFVWNLATILVAELARVINCMFTTVVGIVAATILDPVE